MKRLGKNGAQEVKSHPWLRDFPWAQLMNRTLAPPYRPSDYNNFDILNSMSEWKDENEIHLRHCIEILKRDSVQNIFTNYEYNE